MSIFGNNRSRRDRIVSAFLDEELPASDKEYVETAVARDDSLEQLRDRYAGVKSVLQDSRWGSVSDRDVTDAAARVRAHIERTIRVRPLHPPWWRMQLSVPLPVLSAAAVVILVLAGVLAGTMLTPEAGSGPQTAVTPGLAGVGSPDRQINVQLNVESSQTEQLLQWLNEQSSNQQVTVQLPEQAQFQLRGDPVLIRRQSDGDTGVRDSDLQIVPLEGYLE